MPEVATALTLAADADEQADVPPLENGDNLTATEFLRRYEAMPEVKKAELIGGVTFLMTAPVSEDQHGVPDGLIQMWLGFYAIGTPGTRAATNSTIRLSPDDVVQPDGLLRRWNAERASSPAMKTRYLGAPELAAEVSASHPSIDSRQKRDSYRRAGVREYVVWRTQERALDWWFLQDDDYHPLPVDADGTARSRIFPGLWLSIPALFAFDGARVLAVVQTGLATPEHTEFVHKLQAATGSPEREPVT